MQLSMNLSASQAKFFQMLERAPYLSQLWSIEKAEYNEELVQRYLGTASRGEAIMARFFLGVWCGSDRFDFDFTDAAAVLDRPQMTVITDWLSDPFWP